MAKIWWEPYTGSAAQADRMLGEFAPSNALARRDVPRSLQRRRVLFVRAAGFTFTFHSPEQLAACLAYYRRPLHPSSRSPERAAAVRDGAVGWRWHVQRWYERLPLYLREEPKRRRVVAALGVAARRAAAEGFHSG